MTIKVLSDHVINQISAGEVIDRPASVVRELVDNAVDAGATEVAVYLEAGGKSLIRVTDNGCGMTRDECLLALERHATSKISSAEDLLNISSFGFRGEALPSIASVSKLTLKSRSAACHVASILQVDGGRISSVKQIPGNQGTDIEVRGLFYNTPARRNFLKSNRTEELRTKSWISHFSLVHPQIRFKLFIDGREVLNLAGRSTSLQRAAAFFRGPSLEVSFRKSDYHVSGMVAHPSICQADLTACVLFVNNRLVSDKVIGKAVKEGFDSMLKDREYPVGFLNIRMPPELVDVNVHPQKSEVRFRRPQEVFLAVRSAVLQAVQSFKRPVGAESLRPAAPGGGSSSHSFAYSVPSHQSSGGLAFNLNVQETAPSIEATPRFFEDRQFRYSDIKYIGQIFSCYLLGTIGESFYLIDMHAAHERCNFDLFQKRLKSDAVNQLLIPLSVELTEQGLNTCLEHQTTLAEFGIAVEQFSETALLVRSLPTLIRDSVAISLIKEVAVADLEAEVQGGIQEKFNHVLARLACHASIRSGYEPNREEVYALFDALDKAEISSACPHGRPVAVRYTLQEIEKWFGRDR